MLFADLKAAKNHFAGLTLRQLEFELLEAQQSLVIAHLETLLGTTQTVLREHFEEEQEAYERHRREHPADEDDEDEITDDDIPF